MTKNFTPELLLQYIYQETSEEETKAIKLALKSDKNLQQVYANLMESITLLEEVPLIGMEERIAIKVAQKELAIMHK